MTGEELIASLKAQGFHYLTEPECLAYLQDAYLLDICEGEDWPLLEASKEGTAPLEIKDLRTIEYVTNVTQNHKLEPLTPGRISDDFTPNLTTAGSPEVYYLTEGNTVNVYPTSTTDKLAVRYWRVPEDLTTSTEPLLPKRWHSLIVEGARARAYTNPDDWELSNAADAKFQANLQKMRESLLSQQHDMPDDHVVVEDPAALR